MKNRKIVLSWIYTLVKIFLLGLIFSQGAFYAASAAGAEDFFEALQASRLSERMAVDDFSLPAVAGGEVKLSDFKGKVVFLNFWATWCPYCRTERAGLQALYNKYKDKKFVVLAVSIDRTGLETVKQYVEKNALTFPNLIDQTSAVASQYGIRGVPTTLFIDRQGKAVGGAIGPRNWDSQQAYGLVEQLLSEIN